MKKLLSFLLIFFSFAVIAAKAEVMTFEQALNANGSKPMLVLIYARWADNVVGYLASFKAIQKEYGDTFNYVELDISNPDTKVFNSKFHIYPNLPYVLMLKDRGKITRYLQRECAASPACMSPRIKSFIH